MPQLDNLDTTLTVEQNLLVFAYLYRVPKTRAQGCHRAHARRSRTWATAATRKVDELSGGMRRRLLVARALVHRPRLVMLDEPTVGLDPQVRQELWALIDSLRTEGVSILMSTHYIEEAERLADTVVIMSHGRAVATGKPTELILEHAGGEASRSTARPPSWPRSRPRRRGNGHPHAAHRHVDHAARRRRIERATRRRACAGPRTSRTSSCC